mgnify:CR=1 FL=1
MAEENKVLANREIQMIMQDLWFWRNYTTKQHSEWWKRREINFEAEFDTWQHPHRRVIVHFLSLLKWDNLMEIGFGGGANLRLIAFLFKGRKLVGTEINKKAIEAIKSKFKGLEVRECPATDIFMSDKGVQLAMTDMVLIYVGPFSIMKALREIKRTTTNYVLLCEFHHTNWFKRQWLRLRTGYHSYNYISLLGRLGFYDVIVHPITKAQWPDAKHNAEFRHIILAKIPSR